MSIKGTSLPATTANQSREVRQHFRPVQAAEAPVGLVSIVIPCCGQLEYTRWCVPSLLRHSRPPFELILVDVGSLDGTPEYLAGVSAAAPVRTEVVRSTAEFSFRAACTEALARARGEFVVWMTNDTIVTDKWLQQLVALADFDELIGMVGPMSNYAPAQQRVSPVPYSVRVKSSSQQAGDGAADKLRVDVEGLERFASEWRLQHKGKWFESDGLGGFCLLIKRAVLQKVSLFDERAEQGVFDTYALSWRVRQAGYRCVCCHDLFVHHFGSRLAMT
jgi:O-antigen biosynthesis protein